VNIYRSTVSQHAHLVHFAVGHNLLGVTRPAREEGPVLGHAGQQRGGGGFFGAHVGDLGFHGPRRGEPGHDRLRLVVNALQCRKSDLLSCEESRSGWKRARRPVLHLHRHGYDTYRSAITGHFLCVHIQK